MNTYTAVAPNGQVFTRNSKKTYTHAALILESNGQYSLAGFSGSEELAMKAAKREINWLTSLVANDLKRIRFTLTSEVYAERKARLEAARIADAKRTPLAVKVAA